MVGPTPLGAYSDTFAYDPTTPAERGGACGIAVALVLIATTLISVARTPGPIFTGFVPAVEAIAVTASAFTAWLLISQYRVRPHAPLAILGIAYAVYALFRAGFLFTFPSEPAALLSIAGRLGFAGLAIMFVAIERRRRRSSRWHDVVVRRTLVASLAYAVLAIAVSVAGRFPVPSFFYGLMALLTVGAAAAIVFAVGVTKRIHLWLAVVLVAMSLEIVVEGVFAGARYTIGWYVAHGCEVFSSLLFFCVMQAQLAGIMRRSARNGERALALHDVVSVGTDLGPDQNAALLERAMTDLDFDWACLAQIDDGWVTLETSVGEQLYPDNFRAPAGQAWLRDALKRKDLAFHGPGGDVPWIEESPTLFRGWSTLITIPVFIDEELYGVLGFANIMRRRASLGDGDRAFLRLIAKVAAGMIERRRQRRQLDRLAYNDALTGLPNRAWLLQALTKEISASARYDRQFAVHFLDLDHFKTVNDTHGHHAGDAVLREVAHRLTDCLRAADTVARLGGDEFVVLQPGIQDWPDALLLSTRLRKAFEAPFLVGNEAFTIGVSIGTSRYPADGSEIYGLLDRADVELYRQKKLRRRRAAAEAKPRPVIRGLKRL